MRLSKQPDFSLEFALQELSSAMLKQADEPNLLAYKPHAKQEEFHASTARGRWFLGGNRSGKSVAGVVEDLWWATKRHPYHRIPTETEIRGRVVGSDFKNGIETILFPIFKRWLVPSDLVNGSWEDSYDRELRTLYFGDGSFIEFRSNDQDLQKHAGTSRHFIHFDEEPPQVFFNENLMRLVDTSGNWWITMTPVEGYTWLAETMMEPEKPIPASRLKIVEVVQSDNPYLPKDTEDLNAFLSKDERIKREKGQFVARGGRVLADYSERTHFKLPASWHPPEGWTIWTSQDHGYRTPSAVGWHAVDPRHRKIVTFHEFYDKETLVADIAEYMREFEARAGLKVFMRTGDPALNKRDGITGTSILTEYAHNGIFISTEGVPKDESIGIDRMNDYLQIDPETNEPYWELTKACLKHNWEFKKLPWKTSFVAKNDGKVNPVEKVQDKDNHAFDAAKYFFTFMRDLAEEVETPTEWATDPFLRNIQLGATPPPDMHNPVFNAVNFQSSNLQTVPWEVQSDYGWNYGDWSTT